MLSDLTYMWNLKRKKEKGRKERRNEGRKGRKREREGGRKNPKTELTGPENRLVVARGEAWGWTKCMKLVIKL